MSADRSANRAKNVNVFGSYSDSEWECLKAKYDYRCLACGKQEPEITLTADHIIPISAEGATNYIHGIQPLCRKCNSAKGQKTIDYRPDNNISFKVFDQRGLIIRIFDKKS